MKNNTELDEKFQGRCLGSLTYEETEELCKKMEYEFGVSIWESILVGIFLVGSWGKEEKPWKSEELVSVVWSHYKERVDQHEDMASNQ